MIIPCKVEWVKKVIANGNKNERLDGLVRYESNDRWVDVDVNRFTAADMKYIGKQADAIQAKEPKAVTTLRRLSIFEKLSKNSGGVKVKRLTLLAEALKKFTLGLEHHWLFQAQFDGELAPVLVTDVEYIPKSRMNECPKVRLSFSFVVGRKKTSESHSIYKSNLLGGKTALQVLDEAGFVPESKQLVQDYMTDLERYKTIATRTGVQFSARGVGDGLRTEGVENIPDNCSMIRDGTLTKVVMDDLFNEKDDEDESEEEHSIETAFWTMGLSEDDVDESEGDEDADDKTQVLEIPVHPYAKVFDLEKHIFFRLHVKNLEPYQYEKDLSDKLILPRSQKDLIHVLIETSQDLLDDIIKGKTGGTIVIATGPPGTGKTLTAEILSESIERPLYTVQCSQLGTTEEDLENKLSLVLKRATRWNAILLLDEADVYVHTRGEDIQQNAIVGVFLRLLEYYRGVLFLTSNREVVIDDAILSRATAHIRYEAPGDKALKEIWKVLSKQFGTPMSDADIEDLVSRMKGISGRNVKNLLKLAKRLATKQKKKVDPDLIVYVSTFVDLLGRDNKIVASSRKES